MSKGLEALERIKLVYQCTDIPIIEKELKELEERREMMKRFNEACVPMILDNETEKKLKALEILIKWYQPYIIHDLCCLGANDKEIALVKEVLK